MTCFKMVLDFLESFNNSQIQTAINKTAVNGAIEFEKTKNLVKINRSDIHPNNTISPITSGRSKTIFFIFPIPAIANLNNDSYCSEYLYKNKN